MNDDIFKYMTTTEAAYRWGISIDRLQEKLKPTRRSKKLQQHIDNGLLKVFVSPGKKKGVYIITEELMTMWYGSEPVNERLQEHV